MAAITYDGQSFLVDGRRLWLVSGTIDYARVPHELWAARLHDAKSAGLNCIVTSVPWSRHEVRPGQFDWQGDNNLRHFVELCGHAGLYCILRLGPFIGGGYDLGGLPTWVLALKDVNLRTASAPYLEACSRFIGAVARQVRDLQAIPPAPDEVTTPRPPGPIILVQNESGWRCGHDDLARAYLGELNRYLHESGFEVPIINANDLWSGVEGEVDCWTGRDRLLMHLRQLAQVRPSQPRLLIEYRTGEPVPWGGEGSPLGVPARGRATESDVTRDLCECLCAGAQYNLEPFFGGTNFGFSAGRLGGSLGGFAITSNDLGAALSEAGRPGPLFHAVRRVSMFASRFGRLFSHLDSRRPSVSLLPESVASPTPDGSRRHAVVHCSGTQGSVAFIFSSPPARSSERAPREPLALLLADGLVMPVYPGVQGVTWCVMDFRLAGRSQLDYCNIPPFALVGKVFVAAGPAGTPVRLSINGSPLDMSVPTGDAPEIVEHENVTVVIMNDEHLPRVHVADDAVYIGAAGLTREGDPILESVRDECTRITAAGEISTVHADAPGKVKKAATPLPPPPAPLPAPTPPPPATKGKKVKPAPKPAGKSAKGIVAPPPPPPPPPARVVRPLLRTPLSRAPVGPRLDHWTTVASVDYLEGSSARYASIAGPADLNALGAPYGYGWYRLRLKNPSARRVRIAWPHSADRLHLFLDGKGVGVLGYGPGATTEIDLSLKKGEQTLVALAENLGRASSGQHLADRKGIFGHALSVEPLRTGKPALERGDPIDVLAFKAPIQGVHKGDVTDSTRLCWDLPAKIKGALIVRLAETAHRGLLLLNDEPLAFFDRTGPSNLVIEPERLSRGHNRLSVTLLGDTAGASVDLLQTLTLSVGVEPLTAKAEWAFAKWEAPTPDALRAGAKRSTARGDVPTWHHAEFVTSETPATLVLDTAGLSKGQIYVNGRHLGRFFTATGAGKQVGPQTQFVIPAPWLRHRQPNDLVLFDEHGFSHGRLKLFYKV